MPALMTHCLRSLGSYFVYILQKPLMDFLISVCPASRPRVVVKQESFLSLFSSQMLFNLACEVLVGELLFFGKVMD